MIASHQMLLTRERKLLQQTIEKKVETLGTQMKYGAATKYLNCEKVLFIAIQPLVGREDITTEEITSFLKRNGILWNLDETQAVIDFFCSQSTT